MSTTTSTQVAPSRRRPIRLYQIGSHLFITVMLLLSLIPTYLLITWSFKNGLQYRWERWSISFPLRWSNYAAAW